MQLAVTMLSIDHNRWYFQTYDIALLAGKESAYTAESVARILPRSSSTRAHPNSPLRTAGFFAIVDDQNRRRIHFARPLISRAQTLPSHRKNCAESYIYPAVQRARDWICHLCFQRDEFPPSRRTSPIRTCRPSCYQSTPLSSIPCRTLNWFIPPCLSSQTFVSSSRHCAMRSALLSASSFHMR